MGPPFLLSALSWPPLPDSLCGPPQAEGDWKDVEARLCAVRERLLRRANLVLNITGDATSLSAAMEGPGGAVLQQFVEALPDTGPNRANFMPKGLGADALDREPLWGKDVRELEPLTPGTRAAYITPTQVRMVYATPTHRAPARALATCWARQSCHGALLPLATAVSLTQHQGAAVLSPAAASRLRVHVGVARFQIRIPVCGCR